MSRVNVVFSFDTTGSMYPCLSEVRRNTQGTISQLFKEMPDLKVGIIAHGDYCDKGSTYITKHLPISNNVSKITNFIKEVPPTNGGDAPECYELVLHETKSFNWDSDAEIKILVMIGDSVPHLPAENQNYLHLDWRKESKDLKSMGIRVYGVQCLSREYATRFYSTLSSLTDGIHLELHQFSHVIELIRGICYKQAGPEHLERFEKELKESGHFNRSIASMLDSLMNRKTPTTFGKMDLEAVPPSRFQILHVDKSCSIKDFVVESGATFRKGKGFYAFLKTETIQEEKEVVLMDKFSGDMYSGPKARELIGLPFGERGRIPPARVDKYDVFVQSTSSNRKLIAGTRFLYEAE